MKLIKTIVAAAACVALTMPSMATIATFDWEEVTVGGAWWTGYGYTETDNGVTMISGQRAASLGNNVGAGGSIGNATKAGYVQDALAGLFTMEEGGSATDFTVASLLASGNIGGPEGEASIAGTLDGSEIWKVTFSANTTFATIDGTPFAEGAYTGTWGGTIDTIVWNGTFDSTDTAIAFQSIDNLVVDTIPEPATLGLLGLAGGALMFIRRLKIY